MTKLGAYDHDIALELGITSRTFYRWKAKYPLFRQAVTRGRELQMYMVTDSMFRRATGWITNNEKAFQTGYKTRVEEELPGDPKAAELLLKAHRPDLYREKNVPQIQLDFGASFLTFLDRMDKRERLGVIADAKVIEHKPDPEEGT